MSEEKKDHKKSFLSLFEETHHCCSTPHHHHTNGHHYPGMPTDDESDYADGEEENASLTDELDHEILMHRDSHFGGNFKIMLDYYHGDNPGINPDFEIERIEYLAQVEKETGQNLAAMMLSGAEAEKVAKAKEAYRNLKEIYNVEDAKNPIPRLIADLILTEKEDPHEEVEAVINEGDKIIPELIRILKNEESFDSLFPGYGLSPFLAILCLGLLKDERAIIPIFETLSKDIVFEEEVILDALKEIGDSAKSFLLKQVSSRPLTDDNIHAAFALLAFREDSKVAETCFQQLKDRNVQKESLFAAYLLCNCEALKHTDYKDEFIRLANDASMDEELRQEMKLIIQEWK